MKGSEVDRYKVSVLSRGTIRVYVSTKLFLCHPIYKQNKILAAFVAF